MCFAYHGAWANQEGGQAGILGFSSRKGSETRLRPALNLSGHYVIGPRHTPNSLPLKEELFFSAGLRFCVPKCTDESRSKIVDFYAMKTSKVCRR